MGKIIKCMKCQKLFEYSNCFWCLDCQIQIAENKLKQQKSHLEDLKHQQYEQNEKIRIGLWVDFLQYQYPEGIEQLVLQINPCDFCMVRTKGDCHDYAPKCTDYKEYFWCDLDEIGCGYNEALEGCYGFTQCPNVKKFYQDKKRSK